MVHDIPVSVLLVDADEARGARAAADLVACGFPAAAVTPDAARSREGARRAHVLAIECAAAGSAGAAGSGKALTVDEIADLRRKNEASLVLLWDAARDGGSPSRPPPEWADGIAGGTAALVGRIALHARAMESPIGELAQARRRLEEARTAVHDLTQPLSTIVARAKLLLESVKEGDPAYRPIAIIAQESLRLSKSVDRIREVLPPARRG